MTEQLKQCPFCGGTDIRAHVYGGGEPDAFMQCHDCSADGPNGLNRAGAIEAWNRRAQPAQAEAVPPDVVRDAAPIPDHELVTMYDERPTSDREMIEFAREVERRHGIGVQPQHITDGSPCWCNPDVAYTDPETGASVIVHRRPQ